MRFPSVTECRKRPAANSVIIAILVLLPIGAAAENTSIRMEAGRFLVTGWDPKAGTPSSGWQSVFAVYAGDGDVPPMLGSYSVEDGALVFRPRFPIAPGVRVRAVFRGVETKFDSQPTAARASTRVEHVYPSVDLLPDNQLKFYLHFSAPMSRGEAWRRIHLLDQNGATVDLPFLEVDQELWDRDYRRLTVLFDPGRIKRGLLPLQEVGPAIEEGKRYTLVIDRDWLDANGAPLLEGFRKPFRVGPGDRTPPDPGQWKVTAPRAGTFDALVVNFPKPLDWALLQRLLDVHGVQGTTAVDHNETQWRFAPKEPWKPGEYQLVIDTSLEDLAGNRIGKPFDVDTFERVSQRVSKKTVSLPFRVGKNQR